MCVMMYLHLCIYLVCVCLTCALGANQVFTLRLVRVDGCHGDVIQSVWVQVFEDQRCLFAAQDSLERNTYSESQI